MVEQPSVGIVLVSHSATLAKGVLELARGMAGEDVRIAVAAGMDLPDQPLGTDPALVARAIESVYSEAGVLVLMDLGSAVLSTEMALELLPEEMRSHVLLCEAPLVEGAVSAAVQARLGHPLAQVAVEARTALAFKTDHLQPPAAAPAPPVASAPLPGAQILRLTVTNRLGLHARPAARFVQTAGRFADTEIAVSNLTNGKGPVSAKSINGIATLGVTGGQEIEIQASGPAAEAALAALAALADENFGDVETDAAPEVVKSIGTAPLGAHVGVMGAPGIAFGPVRHLRPAALAVPTHTVEDAEGEWKRLEAAIDATRGQIKRTLDDVRRRADAQAAGIFEAHLLYLDDPSLQEPARERIFSAHANAAAAWNAACSKVAEAYRALPDDYLRGRAADVIDVGRQVVAHLAGQAEGRFTMDAPGVLVAADLTPAVTARLDPAKVLAILTAEGGPTSHSAILARTFGIPAVVGLGGGVLSLEEGMPVLVHAEEGWALPDPPVDVLQRHLDLQAERARRQAEALAASAGPAVSTDGRRVEVAANVGSLAEAQAAHAAGAEGIGLLRTEFLYLDRHTGPDEEEQAEIYRAIAASMGGHPVVIRTLDIGGDKPLPYIDLGTEANPFLGQRAIRLCLARPELLKTQFRAILRAAADHPIRMMLPMVATVEEFRAARTFLQEARQELQARGLAVPDHLETGIMVEVPAAALRAEQLAREVDFFSIGTNDLTQYTMAAERGNPSVAALSDALHPAVLELIQRVVEAAHRYGKWVGVCGELAGEEAAASILLGLGVDELSMNAPAIPRVKQVLRRLSHAAAQKTAAEALVQEDAAAVRRLSRAASAAP